MNYSGIIYDDVANGPGIRTSLFVSGCRRHCKGCFNEEAQDFNYGNEFTTDIEYQIIKSMDKYHKGITILGGEPLEPENAFTLFLFLEKFKMICPDKDIWIYTGNTIEEILAFDKNDYRLKLAMSADVIVDGPFVEELRDISLKFRGSSNQRIICIEKIKNNGD